MHWHRHRKNDETPEKTTEAEEALINAEHDLSDTEGRDPEIAAVVRRVARYGDQNNFAEMIRQAMGGTK